MSVVPSAPERGYAGENRDAVPDGQIPSLFQKIKGIIFDFDGTLFDHAHLPFLLIMANPLDIFRIQKERVIRKRFAGWDYSSVEAYYQAFFAALAKACHRPAAALRSWYFNRYMPRMIRILEKHYTLRPRVEELLSLAAAPEEKYPGQGRFSLKMAVYSDYPMLRQRFEAMGLSPGPRLLLYGPETFGAQKPAPGPFRSIAADMGLRPEEILVIGDREATDGMGAFNAGMHFFCLETGRKRYFRLDPNRAPPKKNEQPYGPSLLMYAGTWEEISSWFLRRYQEYKAAR